MPDSAEPEARSPGRLPGWSRDVGGGGGAVQDHRHQARGGGEEEQAGVHSVEARPSKIRLIHYNKTN